MDITSSKKLYIGLAGVALWSGELLQSDETYMILIVV